MSVFVNYEELRKIIDGLEVKDYEEFSYGDLEFLLMWSDRDRNDPGNLPAESRPSDLADWDIYLWRSIPRDFKRPILLHEILEARIFDYLKMERYLDDNIKAGEIAHRIARRYDNVQLEPNQKPIIVVAVTNKAKLLINPIKGKIRTHPANTNIKVLLWPNLSAINPDSVPPIAEVINIPSKM